MSLGHECGKISFPDGKAKSQRLSIGNVHPKLKLFAFSPVI